MDNSTLITKIRTSTGDHQIDYNALANLPDIYSKSETDSLLSEKASTSEIGEIVSQNSYTKAEILSDTTMNRIGLDENSIPDDAFNNIYKIGSIVNFADTHFLQRVGDMFLPCLGQILPASDYPKFAAAQGPIVGYKWTSRDANVISFTSFAKTTTGRVIALARSASDTTHRYYCISDDNCKTFTIKQNFGHVTQEAVPNKVICTPSGEIWLLGSNKKWISTDNGNTFTFISSTNLSDFYDMYLLPSGRWINYSNKVYVSDNNGITWTAKGPSGISYGGIVTKNGTSLATGSYVYRSTDEWETYTIVHLPNNESVNFFLEYGNIILAITQNSTCISTDDGKSWSLYGDSPGGNYTCARIALPNLILANGKCSIDIGKHWIETDALAEGFCVQSNDGSLVILPRNGSKIYDSSPDTESIILPVANGYICVK